MPPSNPAQWEDTKKNVIQHEIGPCCDSEFSDVFLFALNSTLKQGRINIHNNRRKLESKSQLLMDNKPQSPGSGTWTHTELKELWRLRGFVFRNKQGLPHQSPGQLFTQTTWLEVKRRFASERTRGLDSMQCSLWFFPFSLWATWESISLFQLTWTILLQHYFLLF